MERHVIRCGRDSAQDARGWLEAARMVLRRPGRQVLSWPKRHKRGRKVQEEK
jgi:hypothetical protein